MSRSTVKAWLLSIGRLSEERVDFCFELAACGAQRQEPAIKKDEGKGVLN
jgi:hypothetical protein